MANLEIQLAQILSKLGKSTPPDNFCAIFPRGETNACLVAITMIQELQSGDLNLITIPQGCNRCPLFNEISTAYDQGQDIITSIERSAKSN